LTADTFIHAIFGHFYHKKTFLEQKKCNIDDVDEKKVLHLHVAWLTTESLNKKK
jgi:hypothetical protein